MMLRDELALTCLLLASLVPCGAAWAESYKVSSPDGKIEATVDVAEQLSWSVRLGEQPVVEKCVVAMEMGGGRVLGKSPQVKSHGVKAVSRELRPQVPHRDAVIHSQSNRLTIQFDDYQFVLQVSGDGVGYRFVDQSPSSTTVVDEQMSLTFPASSSSLFPQEESMYSHNERLYLDKKLTEIADGEFCSLPVMFDTGKAKVLLTEASMHHYPCMFVEGTGSDTLAAVFPKYVLRAEPDRRAPDRNQRLVEKADYIAQVSGARAYPWRVFIVSDDDRTFVESNLVTELSGDSKIADASWIKPGKVAWDWYNANNIYGVDFEAGLNTETYKYYIDFAADNGIEYVILDEGWTKSTTEITEWSKDINVPELIEYAASKDVGIILWVLWKPLSEDVDGILDLYSGWGAKGIKVDFMQRSDQGMVDSYEQIAAAAAQRQLIVDFHGAFKPAGIERVWPNVVNYEGVKGNENNKWSEEISPEHTVTIPFIRMAAGPMDFTPGSMINTHPKNFAISFTRPMSMGTRSHQVAMYVVYESPLQMLCESPTVYKREQETVDFIKQIPTVWDETRVLDAKVADYIVVARRKGDRWYIGAMTDATPRELELDLSFLGPGPYSMEMMRDGVNADKHAEDYKRETIDVDSSSKVPIKMVSGGGWAAIITPK